MKKLLLSLCIVLFIGKTAQCQPPVLIKQFEKTYGAGQQSAAYAVQQTADGGYILAGAINGATNGSTNQPANIYVLKTDPAGNELWSKIIPSGSGASAIRQTVDGGYILCGGLGLATVIKLDATGTESWRYTASPGISLYSVVQAPDGSYLATGNNGGANTYALKLTDVGSHFVWEKFLPVNGGGLSIAGANDGSVYISGATNDSRISIIKLDVNGTFQWVRHIAPEVAIGSFQATGNCIKVTAGGEIVMVGRTQTGANQYDYLFIKSDASGNLGSKHIFGGTGDDIPSTVEEIVEGGFLITGISHSFGSGASIWVVKTDIEGNKEWSKPFTTNGLTGNGFEPHSGAGLTVDGGFVAAATLNYGTAGASIYLLKAVVLSATNTFSGHVYIDGVNNNCTYDAGNDVPLANSPVYAIAAATGQMYTVFSDNAGLYEFIFPDNDVYTISQAGVVIPSPVTCPPSQFYVVTLSPGDPPITGKDFGHQYVTGLNQKITYKGTTDFHGLKGPCPGETFTYCNEITNESTTDPFYLNEYFGRFDYSSDTGSPSSINEPMTVEVVENSCNLDFQYHEKLPPNYTWSWFSLVPAVLAPKVSCKVCFDITVPSSYIPGGSGFSKDQILISSTIDGNYDSQPTIFRNDSRLPLFDCSKDPNDKVLVSPQACGAPGYIRNQELEYKVRFQNTGSAPARTVVIEDALDADLDITSLHIVGSSHQITRTEILPDRTLRITFAGIELPDSMSDPLGSNGYVIYKITPNAGLPTGTTIENQSAIYFDKNDPVITNSTFNTIRNDVPDVQLAPFNDVFVSDAPFALTGGTPAGGTYSGDGVSGGQFNPQTAGPGLHPITYSYSENLPEADYSVNQSGSYNPVPGTGTWISLNDDQVSAALPIGFTFNFYDTDYTNFYISSNGFMTFNSGSAHGCCAGSALPSHAANPSNQIAFAWDDLYPPAGGFIEYFTTGTAPNRKLIMNFSDISVFHSTNKEITSQVILYESTNIIEIHTLKAKAKGTMTQGIQNNGGTKAAFLPERNATAFNIQNDFVQFLPPSYGTLCAKSVNKTINVKVAKATISVQGDTILCAGDSTVLTVNEQGTYLWNTGATTKSITVKNTGTYTVSVTFAPGVTVTSDPVHIMVYDPFSASISSNSASVCSGASVSITTALTGGSGTYSYHWNTDASSSGIQANPTQNTTYTVTVSDTRCGSTVLSQPVNVYPVFSASIAGSSNAFCKGESVTVSATATGGSGAYTYKWNTGATTQSINANPMQNTTYNLTVSDVCGSNILSKSITVNNPPMVNAGNDKQIYIGYEPSSATLTANVTANGPAQSYKWNTGATTQSITVSPAHTTTYRVTATNANNCKGQDEVVVKVTDVRCGLGLVKVCEKVLGIEQTLCVPKLTVPALLLLGAKLGECNHSLLRMEKAGDDTKQPRITAYPNPFDEATTFEFSVPKGNASLEIYDVTGKKTAQLFEQEIQSDFETYRVEFNASGNLAKGMYFYKLTNSSGILTGKLILK